MLIGLAIAGDPTACDADDTEEADGVNRLGSTGAQCRDVGDGLEATIEVS